MSITESISDYVQQQFEAFQLAEDDLGSEITASHRLAASIEKHVLVLVLNNGVKSIGLDQEEDSNNADPTNISTFLIPLLLKYVDAALAMESDASNRNAIRRVYALVSALACNLSSKTDDATSTILNRVEMFSSAAPERFRSQACILMGCFASHLAAMLSHRQKKKRPNDEIECLKESLEEIGNILLPRLTDKSQSVRQSAIQATGIVVGLPTSSNPELLEGLLWSMWHDPSVGNRVEAVQAVPIDSAETLDHVVARLRDVKEKVRVAAIEAVRLKVDPRRKDIMTQEHFRDIVRHGLTERCENTNLATTKLICTKWTKAAKFCPVELLRFMGATTYEEESAKALQVLLDTTRMNGSTKSNAILQELSDPEIRSLFSNLDKAMIKLQDPGVIFDEYQLFYTRVACSTAKESSALTFAQKEDLLAKTTPDIPTLCDLFQKHLERFVESVEEEDEECMDQECFVCLQLLQLAKVAGLQEEGSRRHFANVMTNVLGKPETPEDIIEDCVEALRNSHKSEFEFFDAVSVILANLTSSTNHGADDTTNATADHMRVMLIFSVVLENAPSTLSTHDVFDVMTKIILSAVTNSNRTVRELGIGCFGKLGLFSNPATVLSDFKPILLKIAGNKDEAIQCRGQALLALSDWALLFSDILQPYDDSSYGETFDPLLIVKEMMYHENKRLVAIAAEVATKLLFSVQFSDGNLLSLLLVSFLDPNNSQEDSEDVDDDVDIKDVGSPTRMQQLLSLFFPAFCLRSNERRNALVDSIENALGVALEHSKKKKGKKRSAAFPLVKIVDYVYSVAIHNGSVAKLPSDDESSEDSTPTNAKPALSASLQVAKFLIKNEQMLNVTQLRALCKFLGNQDLEIEGNEKELLGKLKDCVEELSFLEDSASLKALSPLVKLLSHVESYEDNLDNEEDDDDVSGSDDEPVSEEDSVSEGSMEDKDLDSVGDTTIDDEFMMGSMSRLSLDNKENPPSDTKTPRKSRRSSTQSNMSALQSLGSPNA